MTYEEARRRARQLLGSNAEIQHDKKSMVFAYRVGVETGTPKRLVWVGIGNSWEEAMADAQSRQTTN